MELSQLSKQLWAKKTRSEDRFLWLPLYQHLQDTKGIMVLLYHHWLSDSQRQVLIHSLANGDEEEILKLVRFLALTHDIGKATPIFQSKQYYSKDPELDFILLKKLQHFKLLLGSNKYLDPGDSPHTKVGQVLLTKFGVPEAIGLIVSGHHGRPSDEKINLRQLLEGHPDHYYQTTKESPVKEKWKRVQKEFFEWAMAGAGYENVESIPTPTMEGQVLLLGLLVMADWIASNERYFPLLDLYRTDEVVNPNRLVDAWNQWRKSDPWVTSTNLDSTTFENRFHFSPRPFQRQVLAELGKTKKPGLIIIEAPMGIGKTELALHLSEMLSGQFGMNGLFFGLPTQATSNGMFPRIVAWLNALGQESGEKLSTRLVHSMAFINTDFQKLKSGDNSDFGDEGQVVVNTWFDGPKTAILDDFVVGTIDQLLLMSLKQKHLFLRHLGLSKKVVILDEIHASSLYSNQFLFKSLEWLSAYQVPVILLTATLPPITKTFLERAYLSGKRMRNRDLKQLAGLDEETSSYPLVTYYDGIEKKVIEDKSPSENLQVQVQFENAENLISILEGIHEGVVGVIVNTVAKAQSLGKELAETIGWEFVEVIHSSFIASERIRKEKDLLEKIGKNGERPHRLFVIGTQVLEQSLDIDFDLLITDWAPIDLIFQRLGRLHRHKRRRPEEFAQPKVLLMNSNDSSSFDSGTLAIYSNYLLYRTKEHLPKILSIPHQIPELIKEVYRIEEEDSQIIFLDEKSKSDYQRDRNKFIAYCTGSSIDSPYLLGSIKKSNTMKKWLILEKVDENAVGIPSVREGEEVVEVIPVTRNQHTKEYEPLLKKCIGGVEEKELLNHTIKLPASLSKAWKIENTIQELERETQAAVPHWKESKWMRGQLALVFDDKYRAKIGSMALLYDVRLGLIKWEGENENL